MENHLLYPGIGEKYGAAFLSQSNIITKVLKYSTAKVVNNYNMVTNNIYNVYDALC